VQHRDSSSRGRSVPATGVSGRRRAAGVAGDEVVVGVAAAGGLADLGVPGELGVEAVEGPEAVGAEREAPRRLGALAPLLHPVDVLPPHLVALVRVLHHAEDQVLRDLLDEAHRRRRSAPPRRCAWDLLVRVPLGRSCGLRLPAVAEWCGWCLRRLRGRVGNWSLGPGSWALLVGGKMAKLGQKGREKEGRFGTEPSEKEKKKREPRNLVFLE